MSRESTPEAGPSETGSNMTVPEALALGVKLHQAGRLPDAEAIYRRILEARPDQPDAWHFLGLIAHQTGRAEQAVEAIRKATMLAPDHAAAHHNLGNVFREQGRLAEAQACFVRVLALAPNQASAHNNLGIVLKEQGQLESASSSFRRALSLQPGYVDAWYHLGNVLLKLERIGEAREAFEKVIELEPGYAEGHYRLGGLHAREGKLAEAAQAFRRAISAQPAHAEAHYELGMVLMESGAIEEAIQVLRQTIVVAPRFSAAFKRLATALTVLGRTGEAAHVWKQWLENDPDNPVPRHMLAAATGEEVPARAGDAFVRTTFDQFAEDFDEQLQRLDYRAPALIEEALRREAIAPAGQLEVLDVGCGTGWCGPFLRSYARRLVGVDLSPGMLEKARARTVYDELVAAELTQFLQAARAEFDLLVSADTLVYLGDLQSAFRGAARALRPGGWLMFTLERAKEEAVGGGFTLHAFGRYSHTEAYVRSKLIEVGLEVCGIVHADLRKEAGTPVPGLIVTARLGVGVGGAELRLGTGYSEG